MPEESMQASIPEVDIPVVPHEAVVEVSRIGNAKKRLVAGNTEDKAKDWQTVQLTNWLTDHLTNWLIDLLTDWLID